MKNLNLLSETIESIQLIKTFGEKVEALYIGDYKANFKEFRNEIFNYIVDNKHTRIVAFMEFIDNNNENDSRGSNSFQLAFMDLSYFEEQLHYAGFSEEFFQELISE